MKELYTKPELEVVLLATADIITTSGEDPEPLVDDEIVLPRDKF